MSRSCDRKSTRFNSSDKAEISLDSIASPKATFSHRHSLDLTWSGSTKRLFRPKPVKHLAKGSAMSPAKPVPLLSTPLRRNSNAVKQQFRGLVQSLPEISPLSKLPMPLKEMYLQPFLHLTTIESYELDSSDSDSEVTTFPKRNRAVWNRPPSQVSPWTVSVSDGTEILRRRYSEETADVLGCTKSLAQRRCKSMKIPAKLFKSVRHEDFR